MREELAGQPLNPNKAPRSSSVMSVKTLTKEEVPRPTYSLVVQKRSNSGICRNDLYYVCVHSVHTRVVRLGDTTNVPTF